MSTRAMSTCGRPRYPAAREHGPRSGWYQSCYRSLYPWRQAAECISGRLLDSGGDFEHFVFYLLVMDSPFTHRAVCVMHSTQQSFLSPKPSFLSPKPKCEAESHNSGGYPKNI